VTDNGVVTVLIIATAMVGFLCTAWHYGNYRRIAPTLPGRERLVLQAFVVVSGGATFVASYFGTLTLRALAGLPPVEWARPVSLLIAELVFLTPVYLVAITLLVRWDREKVERRIEQVDQAKREVARDRRAQEAEDRLTAIEDRE